MPPYNTAAKTRISNVFKVNYVFPPSGRSYRPSITYFFRYKFLLFFDSNNTCLGFQQPCTTPRAMARSDVLIEYGHKQRRQILLQKARSPLKGAISTVTTQPLLLESTPRATRSCANVWIAALSTARPAGAAGVPSIVLVLAVRL
jgi:hypothetical protein